MRKMDFTKLTEYMDALDKNYGVYNADIIIKKDHKVVYRHMVGHSDYEKKVPVNEKDMYFFYSASKVVLSAAVYKTMELGLLKFEDTVDKYLPEFADMKVIDRKVEPGDFRAPMPSLSEPSHPAKAKITIENLLMMEGGLTYDLHSEAIKEEQERAGGKSSTRDIVKAIAKMPLMYEPGYIWSYSLAHDVLAAVLEVVSGMSYGEFLRKYFFDPLGIKDLYFTEPEGTEVSALYVNDWQTGEKKPAPKKLEYKLSENYESGGAGLMGTVDAYSKFIDALANGGVGENGIRVLNEDFTEKILSHLTKGFADEAFKKGGKGSYSYGPGVRVKTDTEKGLSPIGEFGWDSAAGAYVLVDPANKISLFYSQHVLMHMQSYFEIHPAIRDLAYEAMGSEVITCSGVHGDMPGDKIVINAEHVSKAAVILPELVKKINEKQAAGSKKVTVCVCGGSGVGKSEIASVLAQLLPARGHKAYILSGDNYPRRIPMYNDAERLSVFRNGGVQGLMKDGVYTLERMNEVRKWQAEETDADKSHVNDNPWFESYIKGGREALCGYLGTANEQNFDELNSILLAFHEGKDHIFLKRMGRTDTELWYEDVDFSATDVMIVEWTHGNNDLLNGIDIPVLLNSTPEETLAHRRARNRDGKTDSAFTTMVLEIEQNLLKSQAHKAQIIIAKSGELLSFDDYKKLMGE